MTGRPRSSSTPMNSDPHRDKGLQIATRPPLYLLNYFCPLSLGHNCPQYDVFGAHVWSVTHFCILSVRLFCPCILFFSSSPPPHCVLVYCHSGACFARFHISSHFGDGLGARCMPA